MLHSQSSTNLKHLTATTGQSVVALQMAERRHHFICASRQRACAKHVLSMLQVYFNQKIVKSAGCFESISPFCLTKLLPFIIQAISARCAAQTYLLESRIALILWLLLLTFNVQTGNKCHCHEVTNKCHTRTSQGRSSWLILSLHFVLMMCWVLSWSGSLKLFSHTWILNI